MIPINDKLEKRIELLEKRLDRIENAQNPTNYNDIQPKDYVVTHQQLAQRHGEVLLSILDRIKRLKYGWWPPYKI